MIALSIPALKIFIDRTASKVAKARPAKTADSGTITDPLTWPSQLEKGQTETAVSEKVYNAVFEMNLQRNTDVPADDGGLAAAAVNEESGLKTGAETGHAHC